MRHREQQTLRVAQVGVGPIGQASAGLLATKPWAQLVGAVDIDPSKAGQDLGELTGDARVRGCPVLSSFEELTEQVGPIDAAIHTAGSRAEAAIEQIEPMVERGVSVASTCEELLFPWLTAPAAADRLHAQCREQGAQVVGTGVNPGFVMDLLPVVLTGVSQQIEAVRANRVVNATHRRGPLQKKIGSGLAPDDFQQRFANGQAGHAGFKESAALIAHSLGWPWDDVAETLEAVVADQPIKTPHVAVEPGQTRGLHQRCWVRVDGKETIDLDLIMALEEADPHDAIRIHGEPPLSLRFEGGVAGDPATVASAVNALRRLPECSPGLLLMTDLPAPRHG